MVFVESLGFAAANSLHCAGMCGPLAGLFPGGLPGLLAYHGARAAAYTGLGALAGGLGSLGGTSAFASGGGFAMFLGGLMLLFALGLGRAQASASLLGNALPGIMRRAQLLPVSLRAGLLGACTPLLPCGLLYAALAAAILSGNPGTGAVSMLAFALGSCPLLVLAQVQLGWLRRHLGPKGMLRLSQGTLLIAGGVLLFRGWGQLSGIVACH